MNARGSFVSSLLVCLVKPASQPASLPPLTHLVGSIELSGDA